LASQNTSGAAALRYATALVDIAIESGKADAVEKDLIAFQNALNDSQDLRQLTQSPLISRQDKQASVQAIAARAKFQDITSNFLALLAQNNRLNMVLGIINAVRMELSRRRGEISANVQSAFALTKDQEKALQDSLAKAMGQAVAVNVDVNKDLIGGMVVTVGSQMIDDSVKRKLERLKIAMKGGANSNSAADKAA
jgi:F-type H+-transporting ATPase subunit delta